MSTKELNLMYVVSTSGNQLTLSGVGSCVGVCISVSMPLDVIQSLVGRHVWIRGGWGDICTIHSWPVLPKRPDAPTESTQETNQ
jgi:hypothetical protein